jgi:hypothetical protein
MLRLAPSLIGTLRPGGLACQHFGLSDGDFAVYE